MPMQSTVGALTLGATIPPYKAAIPSSVTDDIYLDEMKKRMQFHNAAIGGALRQKRYEAERDIANKEYGMTRRLGKEQTYFSLANLLSSIGYGASSIYGAKMDKRRYDKMKRLREDTEELLLRTLEKNISDIRSIYNPNPDMGIRLPALGM